MKLRLAILLLALFWPGISQTRENSGPGASCEKTQLFVVHGVSFWSTASRVPAFFYTASLHIDADGAYRTYHPGDRLGLDSLNHAGHPGDWWALVTDNQKPSGHPVVQGESDPAPGYYVSMTSLYDPDIPNPRDPRRYVDAAKIPYVVLAPRALKNARLGDFAIAVNLKNGKVAEAIVADESAPELPVGEGSMALAEALGVDSSPRIGGKNGGVGYLIYPNSGNGRPRTVKDIVANSRQLLDTWGGLEKFRGCLESPK